MPRGAPVAALLALCLTATPAAVGDATMQAYHALPWEHDDLGRVDEPDFAVTGVLGVPLENCVASREPFRVPGVGRACVEDSLLGAPGPIAPGCTDDGGRQPSGLCGLWSSGVPSPADQAPSHVVPPHTLGTPGMSGNAAPGGLTPAKGTAVRILDLQYAASVAAGSMVDVNRKLADLGARSLLGGLVRGASGPVIPTAAALWAWYGVWQDLNGNGVVDHQTQGGAALPANEFRWVGNCQGPVGPDVCLREGPVVFPVWVYPGNHHQRCGFVIGCYVPSDHPGRQAICFAAFHLVRNPEVFNCLPAGGFDAETRDGDPLLGPVEHRVAADGEMGDGTGQADATYRLWDFGLPPGYYYDQSLLTTTVVVGGPTALGGDPGSAQGFDLDALQFIDVDVYAAWLPVAGDLIHGSVRPSLRAPWVLARDAYSPLATAADGATNAAALDAPSQALAPLDDRLRDPGWSREPNHPFDRFPGATHAAHPPGGELPESEQRHRGWRNDYSASLAWHAWADIQAVRLNYLYGRWSLFGQCVQPFCAVGGGLWDSSNVLPGAGVTFPREPGDHARSLDPGLYQFRGFAGAWRDAPQTITEEVLDVAATVESASLVVRTDEYTLPPDGWVGNIVNTTGAFRYRGYSDDACFLHGSEQIRAWAVCNPYLAASTLHIDGEAGADQSFGVDVSDAQDYRDGTEFQALTLPPEQARVILVPEGGVWTFPAFVWRDVYDWELGDPSAIEDFTGSGHPIVLNVLPQLEPALRSRVATEDLLLLPLGNHDRGLISEFAFRILLDVPSRDIMLDESVVDVDDYRAWGVAGLTQRPPSGTTGVESNPAQRFVAHAPVPR